MGKRGTEGRSAGRRVFGYIKTSPDIQRTRCVTEKNHVAHPRSRIKKYPGRAIRNPPFEGESEEVGRSRKKNRDNCAEENFPGLLSSSSRSREYSRDGVRVFSCCKAIKRNNIYILLLLQSKESPVRDDARENDIKRCDVNVSQLGKCAGHLRCTNGNGNPDTRAPIILISNLAKPSNSHGHENLDRETEKVKEELGSYYRIHGIALTSILARNIIKRVIQVVIVTPLVPHGAHFSPPGGTRASLGRGGSFSGSLACAAAERAALGRRGGSWCRGGGWRPVRGWSLKVRGTGLIGLMGLRRESGGVGLGSGAALPRVGVHFRFQAAHARCNRKPPGFLPLV